MVRDQAIIMILWDQKEQKWKHIFLNKKTPSAKPKDRVMILKDQGHKFESNLQWVNTLSELTKN